MGLRLAIAGLLLAVALTQGCRDKYPFQYCLFLKQNGLCYLAKVRELCAKACGACGPQTARPPPPTPGPQTAPPPPRTPGPPPACGMPAIQQSRVIGGQDAKPGAWPWQIAMFIRGRFACGGSLVTPEWIVTAAHCVERISDPRAYTIVLGAQDLRIREPSWQTIKVSKVVHHSRYGRLNYDIAMMKLAKPAFLNDRVRTVCLPKADDAVPVGTKCFITGWGKTKHPGSSHPILQQADLPVVSKATCTKLNTAANGIPISDQMVCAGHGPGNRKSGCHGDSGGPFVCQYGNGNAFTLQGAVSWGSARCDTRESYTVFARISHFRSWIGRQIAS